MNRTDQLNELLPERLRPGHSRAAATELDRLADGGWTIDTIHKTLMRGISPSAGPGVVIYLLRELPDTPPNNKGGEPTPTPKWIPHTPCPDQHTGIWGQPCELCRCDPNQPPQHHIATDPWWGWPNLDTIPDDYGPGWLRNPLTTTEGAPTLTTTGDDLRPF